MGKTFLPHQIKFKKGYSHKVLAVHEGGSGKTYCGCLWLSDNRDSDALVICNKRIIKKWQESLKECGTKATVVSKEQFKKLPVKQWSAIVVDEADEFASPLFTRQRSQLSTTLYELIKKYPDMPIFLATATPVRSSPANLHSILCFRGVYIPWKDWRNEFYTLERRPFLPRPAYFPVEGWRSKMRPILEKYADIVLMKDIIDVPVNPEPIFVKTPCSPFTASVEVPKTFHNEHRHEQEGKYKAIRQIGKDFRKIIVVAYYVEQIEALQRALSQNRETFMVHGQVKNQEAILKQANEESDECFLVVQASLGVSWDGDNFPCVVYASMSHKVRDYIQMGYRLTRIRNLHPVNEYHLWGGKWDKKVYETIKSGFDFIPSKW